jgi:hypothetical protein
MGTEFFEFLGDFGRLTYNNNVSVIRFNVFFSCGIYFFQSDSFQIFQIVRIKVGRQIINCSANGKPWIWFEVASKARAKLPVIKAFAAVSSASVTPSSAIHFKLFHDFVHGTIGHLVSYAATRTKSAYYFISSKTRTNTIGIILYLLLDFALI